MNLGKFGKLATKVTAKVVNKLGTKPLKLKAAAPDILIGVGVVGVVGTVVYACIETVKVPTIIADHKDALEDIKCTKDKVDEKTYRKSVTHQYMGTAGELIKTYAGPTVTLCVSLSALLYSHHILQQRLGAIAAAYESLNISFKKYRKDVADVIGEESERQLYYGGKIEKLKDVDPERAKAEEKPKDKIMVFDDNGEMYINGVHYSQYARFFDDGCIGWEKDANYNFQHLLCRQAEWNRVLKTRGYVWLEEIYNDLGIPANYGSHKVGWFRDNPKGDGFIDFGMFEAYKKKSVDFVNGYERTILLDFNVDGEIEKLVWKYEDKQKKLREAVGK